MVMGKKNNRNKSYERNTFPIMQMGKLIFRKVKLFIQRRSLNGSCIGLHFTYALTDYVNTASPLTALWGYNVIRILA